MNTNLLTTQWHTLPEATVRRLQVEKLRRYLRDVVVPFSPHSRALFHEHGFHPDDLHTLEDLDRLPLTSKLDLSSTPEHPNRIRDFLVLPDKAVLARRPANILHALIHGREHVRRALDAKFRPVFMTSTTGRSAEPIPFLFTRYDLDHLALTGKRVFEICGAAPDQRLLNLFPFAPHLAFWQTHYGGVEFGVFQTSTGGGKVMGTDGNLRLIQKIKPDVLIGMPTFLYHVMQHAVEEGLRCESLKRLVCTAWQRPVHVFLPGVLPSDPAPIITRCRLCCLGPGRAGADRCGQSRRRRAVRAPLTRSSGSSCGTAATSTMVDTAHKPASRRLLISVIAKPTSDSHQIVEGML